MTSDPIADYLTRVRNAAMINKKLVVVPYSKIKKEITEILFYQGYFYSYVFEKKNKKNNFNIGKIKIILKYDNSIRSSIIRKIIRISKPGLRKYCNNKTIPIVLNGLGTAIISTSYGLMTDKEARIRKLGGEVLFYIY